MSVPVKDRVGVQHETSKLEVLVTGQRDEQVRGYIEEGIKCLGAAALRAAVVFLWTGAARTLQEKAIGNGSNNLNAALQKHDPKARQVTKIDDFAWVKDKNLSPCWHAVI